MDLYSYATKTYLKGAAGLDRSMMASKTDLADLKTKLDNLDVDKLKNVPTGLSKLSDLVENVVVKKTVYDKLVVKVNAIDTKTSKH